MAITGLIACNDGSDVSRKVGAQCQQQRDCDQLCLTGPAYPDGFCSIPCDRNCPEGTVCVGTIQGVCLFACEEAADCEFLGPTWTCAPQQARLGGEVYACVGE